VSQVDHPDDAAAKGLGFMPLQEVLERCEYLIGSGKIAASKHLENLILSVTHHMHVLKARRDADA